MTSGLPGMAGWTWRLSNSAMSSARMRTTLPVRTQHSRSPLYQAVNVIRGYTPHSRDLFYGISHDAP